MSLRVRFLALSGGLLASRMRGGIEAKRTFPKHFIFELNKVETTFFTTHVIFHIFQALSGTLGSSFGGLWGGLRAPKGLPGESALHPGRLRGALLDNPSIRICRFSKCILLVQGEVKEAPGGPLGPPRGGAGEPGGLPGTPWAAFGGQKAAKGELHENIVFAIVPLVVVKHDIFEFVDFSTFFFPPRLGRQRGTWLGKNRGTANGDDISPWCLLPVHGDPGGMRERCKRLRVLQTLAFGSNTLTHPALKAGGRRI